jgi:hypothetical protein
MLSVTFFKILCRGLWDPLKCWDRAENGCHQKRILKGEVSLYDWPPVWFGISCMTTDNFCFYFQNRLIQTNQTGGQRYSDTLPPLVFPATSQSQTLRRISRSDEVKFCTRKLSMYFWQPGMVAMKFATSSQLQPRMSSTKKREKHSLVSAVIFIIATKGQCYKTVLSVIYEFSE